MGKWHIAAAGLAVVAVSTSSSAGRSRAQDAIVGVWLVEHPTAPFPLHLYVFNADHTMQQANPDAGNPRSSDSDGKGVWTRRGDRITGKWVEIIADRTTHKLSGRGELTFEIVLSGDHLTGKGTFLLYDPAGARTGDAIDAPFTGTRVKAP
ncbi:MAG: hypothetical protein ACKOPG_01985 [Novosphingobium sp.]